MVTAGALHAMALLYACVCLFGMTAAEAQGKVGLQVWAATAGSAPGPALNKAWCESSIITAAVSQPMHEP